jgi:hypothetical protein
LKGGWELAHDSEIFDIENTGKAVQEEFKNIESEDSMGTECPVPSTRSNSTMGPGGRAGSSRRGGTGRRVDERFSTTFSPHYCSSHSNSNPHPFSQLLQLQILLWLDRTLSAEEVTSSWTDTLSWMK